MKTRSCKAKGRNLQNHVRDALIKAFYDDSEQGTDDIRSTIMGCSGEDIWLSDRARESIPYSFECKNTEKLNIWSALEQANVNSAKGEPVVVFKRNRSKPYAVISFDKFIELIKKK